MKVVVSSNISNRRNAALALQEAGHLQRYICAISVGRGSGWFYDLLPEYWQKKLRGRRISGLDPRLVSSVWMAEILQKGLHQLGLISAERANWLGGHLYDLLARRHVKDCDIFHFTNSVGLYSARRAKRMGAVLLCDQRTAYPDTERELVREECEWLGFPTSRQPRGLTHKKQKAEYAVADYFVIGSEFAKRTFIEAGYDPDRVFVVPYGVDIQPDGSTLSRENEVFRVIYVGQIAPRKGLHYLTQAFEELDLPDAELLLIGVAKDELRPSVEKWTKNPLILAPGSVPHVQLNEHYGRSSVFVLPSVSDSFGLATSEAMASGLPVIVTENTGSRELVREGIDGFVAPIRDVEALKESILRLYENRGLCREMGEAAQNRVKSFSWEKYGERLLSVYEEIARREGITL